MTENRRIIINILATYGRSLFGLLCGIFTGRWVLLSLGQVDYGLFGLIAGLTGFITFFNGVLASAIGRFYAISVGAAKTADDKGKALEECQAWFNTAVSVHSVVPLALILIGYPIGIWGIETFFVIPADRVNDCIWLFRFVCVSCFVGMVNVPFQAMYTAKQYIAELTIYSFVTTTLNVVFLYLMVSHPGDWLVKYGLWTCGLSVVPQVIIMLRALFVFPECRLKRGMLFKGERLKALGTFACWQMIGVFSGLLRNQGLAILVNKFFGPRVNAAMQVGNSVNGQANSLSGAMMGAFSPAITTAYGAGDYARMNNLVFTMCKLGVLLSMMFVVPLLLELPEVLRLWLKNPPPYAVGFSALFLSLMLLENSTVGHMIAVNASGRIAKYQVCMGGISMLALPIALMLAYLGGSPYVAVYALFMTVSVYTVVRLYFARRIVGLPVRRWVYSVAVPTSLLFCVEMALGAVPRLALPPCLMRVFITTVLCEVVFFPLSWLFVLDKSEREFVASRIAPKFRKVVSCVN